MIGKVKLFMIGGVLAVIALMGLYIWWQNGEIETLMENNIKLEDAVSEQKAVIEQKERDIEQYRESVGRIIRERNIIENELEGLRQKFDKVKPDGVQRDLGKIGIAKPGLLKKVINNATDKANRCLELAMGAEKKDGEENSECPHLVDDSS